MNPRTTVALLVVALLLGGVVWLSNRHEGAKQEAEAEAKKLFGDLEASQVEWVQLRTKDDRDARLARKDGAWRVMEPVQFPADAGAADGIAGALASMQSEAVIDDPQDAAVYGLGDDAEVVHFLAKGEEHELRIGKKTPVGANSYVSTGADKKVYTVATYRTSAFQRSLDDLRERRPLRFERDDVQRIEVSWPDGHVVVEKHDDGSWHLVEPFAGDADPETIETLLSDLVFLRASGFVDDPPSDAQVGLDQPQYQVTLVGRPAKAGAEPPRWSLAIGSVIETNARAGRAAEHALYKIPQDRFQVLPKTVDAFRFKELSEFAAGDAWGFELAFADPDAKTESRVVTETGERDESGWTTQPDAMAAGKAAQLVAELAHLRAKEIAADQVGGEELAGLGLAPPRASVRVFGKKPAGGGERPVLADVKLGVQKGDRIVARRADRDTIFRADAELAQHVPVSLEAFRNRFVSKEKPAAAAGKSAPAAPAAGAPAPGGASHADPSKDSPTSPSAP